MLQTEVRCGEQAAATNLEARFQTLLDSYGAALARLAASYAGSDRDDLLQEIVIGLWRALPGFRGDCSERTFVYRVAHNRAIAYIARNRKTVLPVGEMDFIDPSIDAESALLRTEGSRCLADAVRRLPLLYRQPVLLMLEGLDYGDIAEVLGISESNVGARLTRARQMLRALLEARDE